MKSSLYLASDKKDKDSLIREYNIRKQYRFPCEYLDKKTLQKRFGINREAALYNESSAQVDAYLLCRKLFEYHIDHSGLEVYSYTEITKYTCKKDHILLNTRQGYEIKANKLICAPGYESEFFLKERVMKLNSTYVLISKPLPSELWPEKCLI